MTTMTALDRRFFHSLGLYILRETPDDQAVPAARRAVALEDLTQEDRDVLKYWTYRWIDDLLNAPPVLRSCPANISESAWEHWRNALIHTWNFDNLIEIEPKTWRRLR